MKKVICMILSVIFCMGLFGCGDGPSQGKNEKTTMLKISYFDGGNGDVWLRTIADAFETVYPDVKVDTGSFLNYSNIESMLSAGIYQCDLLCSITDNTTGGNKGYFISLNDVMDNPVSEEEQFTVREKLGAISDASDFTFNGVTNTYQMPSHLGATSLCYNKSSLDYLFPSGYELPVTTKGLIKMCNDIKNTEKGWGLVYTLDSDAEYAIYLRDILTAQYMGYENFKLYYEGSYKNANGEVKFASDVSDLNNYWHEARRSALEVCSTLYNVRNGYVPTSVKQMDFSKAQAYFWGVTSQVDYMPTAFMVNGDWLYSEVEYLNENKASDIRMMRVPINSEIINVLDTVNSEEKLVECVKYVDSQIEGEAAERPAYLSEKDYQRLLEARKMIWTTHCQQTFSIPYNSKCIDIAKEFLRFVASDEGCYLYSSSLQGRYSPYSRSVVDTKKLNNFTKSLNHILDNMIAVTQQHTLISTIGGLSFFGAHYFSRNLSQGVAPAEILSDFETGLVNNWESMKKSCGIVD